MKLAKLLFVLSFLTFFGCKENILTEFDKADTEVEKHLSYFKDHQLESFGDFNPR